MLLSEAIRLGAMLRPHTTGWDGCALRAACDAMGKRYGHGIAKQHWPWIYEESFGWMTLDSAVPPTLHYCREGHPMYLCLESLNGFAWGRATPHWSREQIADWIEGWEMQLGLRAIPWEVVQQEEHEAVG